MRDVKYVFRYQNIAGGIPGIERLNVSTQSAITKKPSLQEGWRINAKKFFEISSVSIEDWYHSMESGQAYIKKLVVTCAYKFRVTAVYALLGLLLHSKFPGSSVPSRSAITVTFPPCCILLAIAIDSDFVQRRGHLDADKGTSFCGLSQGSCTFTYGVLFTSGLEATYCKKTSLCPHMPKAETQQQLTNLRLRSSN